MATQVDELILSQWVLPLMLTVIPLIFTHFNSLFMKRFSRTILVLLATCSVVFTACKKDDEDPKPKTKAELLTAKSWRVSADASTVTSGGTTVSNDDYADYEACEKDNFTKFEVNKVAKFDEGTTSCSGNPQTEIGSWDFNSDQTKLSLMSPDSAPSSTSLDIVELTETTLKLRYTIASGGDTNTKTTTYTAF